ncbi:MAG: cupin domain-containing protein [Planctomycetota bacterium]
MPLDTELDAEAILALLDLKPMPQEGGYYRETYRAATTLAEEALPEEYIGQRNASTAIYFLITPEECSALHILPSDEVFHFYLGDPVEMLRLGVGSDGDAGDVTTLGTDLAAGQRPQVVVEGGVWQGCRLKDGGRLALLGCTVAPGFDFRDFHVATPTEVEDLAEAYPDYAAMVRRLAPRSSL